MRRPSRLVMTAGLVVVGLAVAAVALNARPRWRLRADLDRITSRVETTVAALALLLILLVVAYALATRRLALREGERGSLWRRYLIGAIVFGAALILARHLHLGGFGHHRSKVQHGVAGHAGQRARTAMHVGVDLWLWLVVLVVTIVVAAVLGARRMRPADAAEAPADATPLDAAVAAASAGSDPRGRVIDAYAAMEAALAETHRLGRGPAQSPQEWLARIAAGRPDVTAAASELTGLFELARFSALRVEAADADRATDLLRGLRSALDVEPAAP